MAFYKKQFSEKFGVYFPQSVIVGRPVSTNTVARRLSQLSTVSRADVLAVLAELPGVMAEFMGQGKSVKLNDLGTFRYKLSTAGVENEEDFDFQKQVKAVRVRFVPERMGGGASGAVTRALVPEGIEWTEWNGQAASGGSGSGSDDDDPSHGGGSGEDPLPGA